MYVCLRGNGLGWYRVTAGALKIIGYVCTSVLRYTELPVSRDSYEHKMRELKRMDQCFWIPASCTPRSDCEMGRVRLKAG